MRKVLVIVLILLAFGQANAQNYPAYSADRLMSRVANADTVYVVNFWATWCAPCVKELPVFDTLQDAYKGKKVKVILASFDFKDAYVKQLTLFVSKKHPKPEIVWFSETNANEFIPKIYEPWGGALPATMVIKGTSKTFFDGTVTLPEVKKAIDEKL